MARTQKNTFIYLPLTYIRRQLVNTFYIQSWHQYLVRYYLGDQIKDAEVGRAYGMHEGGEKYIQSFGGKPERIRPLGRVRHWWEDDIKVDIKEMGLKAADWINLDEDRDQGWVVVNMVINESARTEYCASWYILIIKANKMHYFSTLVWRELYMFWTGLMSIIRSLNTVFTAIGICRPVIPTAVNTVFRLLIMDSKPVQNM